MNKLSIICITILLLCVSLYKIKAPERENKNIIKVSFINMWPGFTIDELPMIKEIIEENGRTIVIDHNNYV